MYIEKADVGSAFLSRTPLSTVKEEQEILRAQSANPKQNGTATSANPGTSNLEFKSCTFGRGKVLSNALPKKL